MSAGSSGYSLTPSSVSKSAEITWPERYLLRPFFVPNNLNLNSRKSQVSSHYNPAIIPQTARELMTLVRYPKEV